MFVLFGRVPYVEETFLGVYSSRELAIAAFAALTEEEAEYFSEFAIVDAIVDAPAGVFSPMEFSDYIE